MLLDPSVQFIVKMYRVYFFELFSKFWYEFESYTYWYLSGLHNREMMSCYPEFEIFKLARAYLKYNWVSFGISWIDCFQWNIRLRNGSNFWTYQNQLLVVLFPPLHNFKSILKVRFMDAHDVKPNTMT